MPSGLRCDKLAGLGQRSREVALELSLHTRVNIAEAVLDEALIEPAEQERVTAELERFTGDPTTALSPPRVFQAWGARPA